MPTKATKSGHGPCSQQSRKSRGMKSNSGGSDHQARPTRVIFEVRTGSTPGRLPSHMLNQVHVNHLPYMPFPPNWPAYIPKDKLAAWFEAYVESMELNYWTGTDSQAAHMTKRTGGGQSCSAASTAQAAQ